MDCRNGQLTVLTSMQNTSYLESLMEKRPLGIFHLGEVHFSATDEVPSEQSDPPIILLEPDALAIGLLDKKRSGKWLCYIARTN